MWIGVAKEIKDNEYRVGLTPACARELVSRGHQVMVQAGAGAALGLSDAQYEAAGAKLAADAKAVYDRVSRSRSHNHANWRCSSLGRSSMHTCIWPRIVS